MDFYSWSSLTLSPGSLLPTSSMFRRTAGRARFVGGSLGMAMLIAVALSHLNSQQSKPSPSQLMSWSNAYDDGTST
jgi:hypothetical protein